MEKVVVFDLDGVLVDNSKRLKRSLEEVGASSLASLRGKQREKFWSIFLSDKHIDLDEPIYENIEKARKYKEEGYKVVVVTGRPSTMRKRTLVQLRAFGVPFDEIMFRERGDYRKVWQYKVEALRGLGNVVAFYDDEEEVLMRVKSSFPNVKCYLCRGSKIVEYSPKNLLSYFNGP